MNLNQLIIFHAVAKNRGFSRAAKELFLTQPGVSKHVKHLEEHFGLPLFDRLGKRVILTQAGKILYRTTQKMFNLLDDTELKIKEMKGMTVGNLTIGASFTAGIYIIPNILSRFRKMYPNIQFSLDISLSQEISEKILSNHIDIGILGARVDDDQLVIDAFKKDRLVLIIPSQHQWNKRRSIRISELTNQPLILARSGSGTRTIVESRIQKSGVNLKKKMEFGNTESVKKAVAAGLGMAIISEYAVKKDVKEGLIKTLKISDLNLERLFYYAYHKDKYLIKPVRELIKLLNQ